MTAYQNFKDKEDNSLKSSKDKIKNNLNNNRNEQIEKQNILDENYSKKEATLEQNDENKNNETQYYELTTNGLVEKIKNDYEDIYVNQQNDINRFVEKLANENSELKLEISKLKTELIKLQTKNDFNSNFNLLQNENTNTETNKINNNLEITSQKIELEKKNIKEEYNYILNNISSNLITKNVKSLYDKLIQSKNDLLNCQKINLMLQQENEKLKAENEKIKSIINEEKNKIIEKIIEIQVKTNSDIDANKNLLVPIYENYNFKNKIDTNPANKNEINPESDKLNNLYLYYIEKIKNLTYEKNKLLASNYDFFVKINDLSQMIEEKNNIINEQLKSISSNELKILNLEQDLNSINIKYKETSNQLKEAQEKINELNLEKIGNVIFKEKQFENKNSISNHQQENKINQLNQSLDELTNKYFTLNKNYLELKEKNEKLLNDNLLKKDQVDKIIKEKNQMIKDINNLKTESKLKEEQYKTNINEYENKIKYIKENNNNGNDTNKRNNNNVDLEQMQSLINNIYEKISYNLNSNNIINNNISLFVKNNINDSAKLNEINKQINLFYKKEEIYTLIIVENEKLKNHIKEIINLTLEKTNLTYIEKFKEEFTNISFEQLLLKIINYIKVYKICFLLQKIKTAVNYSEKYINWLNEKDLYKSNNSSFEELKSEINNINEEINNIKEMLKNNSLDFENKIKNFLSKDEIKLEINNIQKKYEKIITDIFEYFLKYKTSNLREHENKEILALQIPIKTYNLMVENNMDNLSLISQSIDSWNLYVNNDLNENNDNVFQEIINMTNIHDNLEYNNISDVINNNKLENYEENNNVIENNESISNDNDNINEENKNNIEEGEKDESESKNNNNSESGSKRNESQYSSENKEEEI